MDMIKRAFSLQLKFNEVVVWTQEISYQSGFFQLFGYYFILLVNIFLKVATVKLVFDQVFLSIVVLTKRGNNCD